MGVDLRAEFKEPRNPMTLASLRSALDDLEAHGSVPYDARLKVTTYREGGWEIVASWTPDASSTPVEAPPYLKDPEPAPLPVEEVFLCHRCGDPIVADGSRKSGYRHQYEDALRTAHAALRYRPARDNPQA